MTKLRILVIALLTGSLLAVPNVAGAAITITGAGSTFSEVAIKQWIADVSRQGLSVNYSGVGSTQGRDQYINNKQNIDFAVSEIPFEPSEVSQLRSKNLSFQYLPIVAGGTSLMYNLSDKAGARITTLRLSGEAAAKIFTGKISKWNDPAIAAENGTLALPDTPISPVIRSDGSGTSAQFSAYLSKMFPSVWSGFASGATSNWPTFPRSIAKPGSDGVANFVAANEGTVTYVEAAYAEQRKIPTALMKNASGNFTKPNSGNVALALTKATFREDRSQNLDDVYTHPGAEAYPISSYSYMITPTKAEDITTEEAVILGKFMIYFACQGQRDADRLGYSPLPRNLVQGVFDAVNAIPGAPTPPALDAANCPNPTITGEAAAPTGAAPPAATTTTTAAGGGGGGGGGGNAATTTTPGGAATTVPSGGNQAASNDNGGGTSGSGSNPASGDGGGSNTGSGDGAGSGAPDSGSGNSAGGSDNGSGSPAAGGAKGGSKTQKPSGSTGPKTTKSATGPKASPSTAKGPKAAPKSSSAGGKSAGVTPLPSTSTDPGASEVQEGDSGVVLDSGSSAELLVRLENVETRLAELEAVAFGTAANDDEPVDPELKDDLLAAADKVDSGSGGGSMLAILLLSLMALSPFLKSGLRVAGERLKGRLPRQ